MLDGDKLVEKSKKVDQILLDCTTKLNSNEKKQSDVVKNLSKKTDEVKVSKVKREIEAL